MGMGDKKERYVPYHPSVRCDVTGKMFHSMAIRECPNRHVIARYGTGGVAHVNMYSCRKCVFGVKHKFFGGVSCGYGLGL